MSFSSMEENCGSSAFEEKKMDVHTKLIRKYKQVPEWWFSCILLMNITATVFICEYYKDQLQLSWWGVLLERGLAFFFTIPIGVITATTNQSHTVRMGVQVLDRCRMRIASIKHLGSLWALKRSC